MSKKDDDYADGLLAGLTMASVAALVVSWPDVVTRVKKGYDLFVKDIAQAVKDAE